MIDGPGMPEAVSIRTEGQAPRRQRVVYPNTGGLPGENAHALELYAREAMENALGMHALYPGRIRLEQVQRDIERAALPAMRLAEHTRRNAYGEYIYASATDASGTTCVLAWQRLGDQAPLAPWVLALTRSYRYCAPATSADALLDRFDAMRLRFGIGLGSLPE